MRAQTVMQTCLRTAGFLCGLIVPLTLQPALALTINEKLNGKSSNYDWQAINGACLTAGDASTATNRSTIPACIGLKYYKEKNSTPVGGTTGQMLDEQPDSDGEGALRLTNGATKAKLKNADNQTGAVYSNFDFPSNQGVDITFKTVTYGGNGYANSARKPSGADGIVFFLVDADQVKSIPKDQATVGAFGGSLGFSCSNNKADANGIPGGYIGLGIDEFGNFANARDNTHTGIGSGQTPNLVSLRGAGNTHWDFLSFNYPALYPTWRLNTRELQQAAVRQTCSTGRLWDYSQNANRPRPTTTPATFLNYPWIISRTLGADISSQQAVHRPRRDQADPITYNLRITSDGLLTLKYRLRSGQETPILTDQKITEKNGPLPASFRFGFAASTGGGSNIHEIMCFKAEQIAGSSSSSAGNVPPHGRLQVGTQLYLAAYHTKNWWGQLTAQNLVVNPDQTVRINPQANWDASCVLTGGVCTPTNNKQNVPPQTGRRLLTWNGKAGVTLEFNNLNAEQKKALGNNTANAANFIAYLKGERSKEFDNKGIGTFRKRDSLLGDIMHSSPVWRGAPESPYGEVWSDLLYPNAKHPEGDSYKQFAIDKRTRSSVVYVGANDGFLHGFRAGKSKPDGSFDTTNNDGRELIGYMPGQTLLTIGNPEGDDRLHFGATAYSHNAFVDAAPAVDDLYVEGRWQTWLAGGLGRGGNIHPETRRPTGVIADDTSIGTGAIYVLDVTEPDSFASNSPASIVKGEWTSETLTCEGRLDAKACGEHLGNTLGTPLIRKLHNGQWGIIFPNGQNSKSGRSGLFILLIDPQSGAQSFRFLPAGLPETNAKGDITLRNGITQVTAVDLDGDHITDYVYGGDMRGHLWRFDLTSDKPDAWKVGNAPIFSTGGKPITSAPIVTSTTQDKMFRVMISFGTGKVYPRVFDTGSYVKPGTHALYGVWDVDMDDWNRRSRIQYQSIAGAARTYTANDLTTQTLTTHKYSDEDAEINGLRSISSNPVCWRNSTTCRGINNSLGWRVELPGDNEQVIYNPTYQNGFMVVNTTIPEVSQALSCDIQAASGFTFALRPDSGTVSPGKSYFKLEGFKGDIAAMGASGVGSTMSVDTGNNRTFLITQTHRGSGNILEVNPSANVTTSRVNWRRIR